MKKTPPVLIALVGLLLAQAIASGQGVLPSEAEAVKKYVLEKDYPEVFGDQRYRTRATNLVIADVDNDGRNEVVVHYFPHYRQSATIVFYRFDKNMEVTRVKEGLAPGPLQLVSGDYLDSHALGMAADFFLTDVENSPATREKLIKATLNDSGNIVAYKNFYHLDSRSGRSAYVDMTHIDNPPGSRKCADFEFSKVHEIAVGPLKGQKQNYLAAWVGNEIYVYLIKAFREDGLLDKQLWVYKAPDGFKGFVPRKGLAYTTKSGGVEILEIDNK